MNKNLLFFLISFFIIATILTGCYNSSPTGSEDWEVVKIGWVGSLAGEERGWGQSELNTIKMLFEEINHNGGLLGKHLKIIEYNTGENVKETINAALNLAAQDEIIALIVSYDSQNDIYIYSELEEIKIPVITTAAANPGATRNGQVHPFVFSVVFEDSYQGAVAAGYAYDILGFTKAAILFDIKDDYSQGLSKEFENYFKEKGGEIVEKKGFKSGDLDFRTYLTKINNADPDIIFMPYSFKEVALTAMQANELGIDIILMGGDRWAAGQLTETDKDAVEGSYFVTQVGYDDPEIQDFKNAYSEKYNIPVELKGILAYDAVRLLESAILTANSFDPIEIRDALKTADVKGITGQITINPDTHGPEGKDAAIIRIVDGEFLFQQRYQAR